MFCWTAARVFTKMYKPIENVNIRTCMCDTSIRYTYSIVTLALLSDFY